MQDNTTLKRVLYNSDGTIDEVVASSNIVHLEQMSDVEYFLGIGDNLIWLSSDTPISVQFEFSDTPLKEKTHEPPLREEGKVVWERMKADGRVNIKEWEKWEADD